MTFIDGFQKHHYRDLATADLLLGLTTLTTVSCNSISQGEQERITLGEKGAYINFTLKIPKYINN